MAAALPLTPAEAYQELVIPSRTQALMNELVRPAYVMNLRWDIVAWNHLADKLLNFSELEAPERNLLRMVFTNPGLRRRLPNWQQDASRLLAHFRCDLAVAPKDPVLQALVEDLCRLSRDFRRWWEAPNMEGYNRGITSIIDTEGVPNLFAHEILTVDAHRHLRMAAYFNVGD